eukprot:3966692-Alexandrium_andersonii.AAC.1
MPGAARARTAPTIGSQGQSAKSLPSVSCPAGRAVAPRQGVATAAPGPPPDWHLCGADAAGRG